MKLYQIGKISTFFSFLFLLIFSFGCSCSKPSSQLKVRIGIDPNWYPLDFGRQTAYVNGFTEDLLLEMAKSKDMEFVRINVNSGSLISGLNEGKYDAILTSLAPFEYNAAKYDFSKNFLDVGPVLVVDMKSPFVNLSKIKGESVGIISGDSSLDILQKYPEISIRTFPTTPDLLNAVATGEIAGALLDKIPAVSYVADLYSGKLKIVSSPLTNTGLHLIARKGEKEDVVCLFDRQLKGLKKKKMGQLLKKWSLNLSYS